ncbi:MAG: HD domain-containing protein [Thermomicrobiales bacterium]
MLEVVAYRGVDEANRVGYSVPVNGSKAGSVYSTGEPLLVDDVLEDDSAYGRGDADWRSLMVAPLVSGQQTFGAIMVGHQVPALYGVRELRIVEIAATHIANAIYRMIEEDREQSQYRAAVEALAAAVDARDPYTHTHSRRVSDLAGRLAASLEMPDRVVEQVRLAGLLHDIGKIGIPDRVLTKPGRLDAEERLIMMSHAEMGARIVDSSPTLGHLTRMIRHHHEWFDGRGYPDGLRGDEIPIEAMILGISDALETMTSNRIYRAALSVEQARQELISGRGSQFHPDTVDAMLELIDNDPVVRQMVTEESGAPQDTSMLSPLRISDVVDLRVLTRIASEIGTLTEIDTFLDHVHKIVREELDLADVAIWLYDEDGRQFRLAAGEIELPVPNQLEASASVIHGSHVTSNTAVILSRGQSSGIADRTAIFPMYVEDSLVGLIELVLRQPGQVDGRDVDLLQAIAAPVASTVRVAQLHDAAKRAATIDGLTGVLNHRAFYDELDSHMKHLGEDEAVSLLIVDVIGLKAINDNYGHLTGDAVLKTIANALVSRLRTVTSSPGSEASSRRFASSLDAPIDRIISRLEEPVPCEVEDGTILERPPCALRLGQSVSGDTRVAELVARADSLLYRRIRPTSR